MVVSLRTIKRAVRHLEFPGLADTLDLERRASRCRERGTGVSRAGKYAWLERSRTTEPAAMPSWPTRAPTWAEKRVERLMKRRPGRRQPPQGTRTTFREERVRPACDLVDRDFRADEPDRLWVADITYIPAWAGFLYLTVVLNAFSRRVVGSAMGHDLKARLVLDALNMALAQRKPVDVIHRSDQGSKYTSVAFGLRCKEAAVRPSMGSSAMRMTTRCARASSQRSSAS